MPEWKNLKYSFAQILGREYVVNSESEIELAETATFSTNQKIPLILKPGTHEEVVSCVNLANKYKTPIYPVSGGRNWGLGSRVPAQDGCILLELQRLNRIVDFNEKLGYITLEPGVTFQSVHDFLVQQNSELFLAVIGGPPSASVIGNAIERGDGFGPLGDRFAHTCALRVILPNGEVVETGYGRFNGISTKNLHRWGVGPYVDGLFTQSNLGIVTKMTFWLQPKPKSFSAFVFTVEDEDQIPELVNALQELQKHDVIKPSSLALWNAYKVLASARQYPWDLTMGKTPISPQLLKDLNRQLGFKPFIGIGGLYAASSKIGRGQRQLVKKMIKKKVDRLLFFGEREVRIANLAPRLVKRITGVEPSSLGRLVSIYKGVPAEVSLRSAYWRKRMPRPSDQDLHPDKDHCGIVWTCHAFPYEGKELLRIFKDVEKIILNYGFEPNLAVIFPSERCCYIFPAIIYDRDVEGEDERALLAHNMIMKYMFKHGHAPYRLGIQSMNVMNLEQGGYTNLIRSIKGIVDPEDILAPGRYSP